MAHQYCYQMYKLNKHHGDKHVLKDITLAFFPGAKIGVIGGNGAGKSTLLRIMAGLDDNYKGEASRAPGVTVGIVEQEPKLDPTKTVRENLLEAVKETSDLLKRYDAVNDALGTETDGDKMQALLDELATLQDKLDATEAWDLDRKLDQASDALLLPPPDADVTKLSGGERRRVALCKVLLQRPDILLLDEPTNHLDAETVGWLEHHLATYPGMIIAVTHDRYFLDNVAEWILELDMGRGIPWKGNYTSWLEQKKTRLEVEEKQSKDRTKILERELEWVRMTPSGRNTKSKARLQNYEKMAAQEIETREDAIELQIPPGPYLGNEVIELKDVSKAFGDQVLIDKLSFRLPRSGIVGIIGPNGAGKTTLFRMLIGQEKQDSGEIELGKTVQLAYVDQNRESLNPDKTVFEEITGGTDWMKFGKVEIASRAYVRRFNFKGTDQQKLVGQLSGGERNRVQLAKLLRTGGNVLLLDEPTNDLDVETLRVLEGALESFAGCVLVISHDRWFLDRIATHMLSFEGEGKVLWYEGNFQAFEEYKKNVLGIDPEVNRKSRYRKLVKQ